MKSPPPANPNPSSNMKRAMPWSDEEEDSSEESSSHSDNESDDGVGKKKEKNKSRSEQSSKGKTGKQKSSGMSFEALKQHGFKGGLSVLGVPPPKDDDAQKDWSWSTGREGRKTEDADESYKERQRTRAALASGEQLADVQTRKEKKNLSFSQKEKKKRDLGQASRGKNYVEEEKRLLRDSGVYSGFDS